MKVKASIFVTILNAVALMSFGQAVSPSYSELDKRLQKEELGAMDTLAFQAMAKINTWNWFSSCASYGKTEDEAVRKRVMNTIEISTAETLIVKGIEFEGDPLLAAITRTNQIVENGIDTKKLNELTSEGYFRSVLIDNKIIIHYDLIKKDKSFDEDKMEVWSLEISAIEFL